MWLLSVRRLEPVGLLLVCFFFFKQKTAYEMRISDWSSDVCSSDLEFLHLDPADIIIGTNVRNDLRPDHKEFRKSIKERGVLEAVTVYRSEDGDRKSVV